MQEKIKEILSLPQEEGMKKYQEFLKDFYQTPVLWTVLHRDYCSIPEVCGSPISVNNPDNDVTFIRLFSEYHFAVEFCVNNPAYTYGGIPLVTKLRKENNYSNIFSLAPHMKVSRICLDDAPGAHVFNFGLYDLITSNNINTNLSFLLPEGAEPPKYINFNKEWIDLFSVEMCKEFISPIINSYFGNEKAAVSEYMEKKAPLLYVLFTCNHFCNTLSDEEWVKKYPEDTEKAQELIRFTKNVLIKRLECDRRESDSAALLTLGDDDRFYMCGDGIVGILMSDFGRQAYVRSINKNHNCDVKCYEIPQGKIREALVSLGSSGITGLRFLLPYNDNINVVVPLDEVFDIIGG